MLSVQPALGVSGEPLTDADGQQLYEAEVVGVTQPGWAMGCRPCPLTAAYVAVTNALAWIRTNTNYLTPPWRAPDEPTPPARFLSMTIEAEPGTIVPQSRPRTKVVTPRGGKPFVQTFSSSTKRLKAWRQLLRVEADQALASAGGKDLGEGPLMIELTFRLARPRSHYESDGFKLKKDAPAVVNKGKGDFDNLAKAVVDELEAAGWFRNDEQIMYCTIIREWAERYMGDELEVEVRQWAVKVRA